MQSNFQNLKKKNNSPFQILTTCIIPIFYDLNYCSSTMHDNQAAKSNPRPPMLIFNLRSRDFERSSEDLCLGYFSKGAHICYPWLNTVLPWVNSHLSYPSWILPAAVFSSGRFFVIGVAIELGGTGVALLNRISPNSNLCPWLTGQFSDLIFVYFPDAPMKFGPRLRFHWDSSTLLVRGDWTAVEVAFPVRFFS